MQVVHDYEANPRHDIFSRNENTYFLNACQQQRIHNLLNIEMSWEILITIIGTESDHDDAKLTTTHISENKMPGCQVNFQISNINY